MYLKQFNIRGIKCFDQLSLTLPDQEGDHSGWIVLLGGNGVGKSTLLQAVALTLMGPLSGQRLMRPEGWVREEFLHGTIEAELVRGSKDSQLGQTRNKPYVVQYAVVGPNEVTLDGQAYDQPQLVHRGDKKEQTALFSGPFAAKRPGWFSCGYGPFRRLSGGDPANRWTSERETRFATLFSESTALTQCEDWLIHNYSRSIDQFNKDRERDQAALQTIQQIVNQLLPNTMRIERIDSQHVYVRTNGRVVVSLPELSDGYRSFLALVIDLLRHVTECGLNLNDLIVKDGEGIAVAIEGIVLVDEIDTHLHPVWQRNIGFQLRKLFPKMQFIVTSHSPFVAQAATDGGLFVLRSDQAGVVTVSQPVDSVRGWRVDQILQSDLFGLTETRDAETEHLLHRHQTLVAQRTWNSLSPAEQRELATLEQQLSERLTAPGESVAEREQQVQMAEYVKRTLTSIGNTP